MPKKKPTILHYKWSLDEGHVTPQIFHVKPFRGILLTREPKKDWKKSPYKKQILPLDRFLSNPRKIIKRYNVKAIHVHHATLAKKFVSIRKKNSVPLIVGFRGKDATSFPRSKKNRKFLKKLFKTGDLFLPVCHHLKKKIMKLGCPKKKIRVLHGGVDLQRFRYKTRIPPKHGPVRFLAVGRFVEKKGFEDLIDAFAAVRKSHKNIQLTLIGDGPLKKKYRKKINKHGLSKQVKIKSWIDYRKIQREYHQAHIFCAPSCTDREGNQEGIPNTLKEAMATGMPCIATKHAGNGEIVKDGINGLLVPERNKKKLAKAMKKVIKNKKKWKNWGHGARKKINKDFNLKVQLAKQRKYYKQVLR